MVKAAKLHDTAPLTVANGNWGATSLNTIYAVLESVRDGLVEAFGKEPDQPVCVAPWNKEYPLVVDDLRPYQIFLTARDTYWSQYVYQFSHELCHVLTNFDRHKEHRHKWVEETLCELSSLFVLHRLAKVWSESPPVGISKASDFAPNHRKYAKDIETKYTTSPGRDLSDWLAKNIQTLEKCPLRRELNGVVAVALLDRFRDEPSLWRDCGWLNYWDPSADATFFDYLESWSACLHRNRLGSRVPTIMKSLFQSDTALRYCGTTGG